MSWYTPTFEVIKMDAEIGSYQEEPDAPSEPAFVCEARHVRADIEPHAEAVQAPSTST
jgi:hypothetical protein